MSDHSNLDDSNDSKKLVAKAKILIETGPAFYDQADELLKRAIQIDHEVMEEIAQKIAARQASGEDTQAILEDLRSIRSGKQST